MSAPLYAMTDTWNNSSTVFTGLSVAVTNTSSAAGSVLFDFRVGANSVFSYDVGNNTLNLQNATSTQTFNLYQTYTNSSNYERLSIYTSAGGDRTIVFEAQAAGTGSQRNLRFTGGDGTGSNGIYFWNPAFPTGSVWSMQVISGAGEFQTEVLVVDSKNFADTKLGRGGVGIFKFMSAGSFSANASVATVLGSVGPSGSHTTVQTWLTIVDSGGTTRYIPCF